MERRCTVVEVPLRVESAFRDMKSPLAMRPIFHQLQERAESHIFVCVLAYHLLVAIEMLLHDNGLSISWETVRKILSTHQVVTGVFLTADQRRLGLTTAGYRQTRFRASPRIVLPLES